MFLWRLIQSVILFKEVTAVRANEELPRDSPLKGLPLFLDKYDLLRLNRRLDNSNLPYEARCPLVVRDAPIIRSYVSYVHSTFANHGGGHTTEYYIRQTIHCPGLARITQDEVFGCITCRRYRTGQSLSIPMGQLPTVRVTPGFAFQHIGVDIAGPLRNHKDQLSKFYMLLFTCLKSRAVHLEVIETRETVAIMRASLYIVTTKKVLSNYRKHYNKFIRDIMRPYID